jgi:hypothetical protein
VYCQILTWFFHCLAKAAASHAKKAAPKRVKKTAAKKAAPKKAAKKSAKKAATKKAAPKK